MVEQIHESMNQAFLEFYRTPSRTSKGFDISSHRYYTIDVEQVYSRFYEVVNVIEKEFINSVLPEKTTLKILPVVIVFSLLLAGVFALILSSGKTSNPEGPGTSEPL